MCECLVTFSHVSFTHALFDAILYFWCWFMVHGSSCARDVHAAQDAAIVRVGSDACSVSVIPPDAPNRCVRVRVPSKANLVSKQTAVIACLEY